MNKSAIVLAVSLSVFCGEPSYARTEKPSSHRRRAPSGRATSTSSRPSKPAAHSSPKVGSLKSVSTKSAARSVNTKRRSSAVAQRSTQQVPTPDRYREIQQALADKGYLAGAVNGQWGEDSTEALKRFQKEQNLAVTGKLDSVSLIALGLGPKRNLSARTTTGSRPKDENRRPEGSEGP